MSAFPCKFAFYEFALFEFKVMAFGLTNTPSTFQYFMNKSLARLEEFCVIYPDYIIVYSTCMQQHLGHLHSVLSRLWDHMRQLSTQSVIFSRAHSTLSTT